MNKRYETKDLNFEYHYFSGTNILRDFIASIELPRRVARWSVNMAPSKTPYLVITCDETEQDCDKREALRIFEEGI